jgi:predicted membrane protein
MELFSISFILFFIMFLLSSLAFGVGFVFIIIYAVKQKSKDDNSPRVTLEAKVIDKRSASYRHHTPNSHLSHRHYYHYVNFELQDGQRTELRVDRIDFDSLCVADEGMLTLQGTRFISFERKGGVAH